MFERPRDYVRWLVLTAVLWGLFVSLFIGDGFTVGRWLVDIALFLIAGALLGILAFRVNARRG